MDHDLLPFRDSLLQPLGELQDLTSQRSHSSPVSLSADEARREALKVVDRRRWWRRRKVETESELVLHRWERSEETGRRFGNGRGVWRGNDGRIRGGGWAAAGGELNRGESLSERLRRRGFVVLVMVMNSVRVVGVVLRLRFVVMMMVVLVMSSMMVRIEDGGSVVESHRVWHLGLVEGLQQ